MKILQICHKPPYPPSDGGTIAMNNVTQGLLHAGHRVKVLAIETPKHKVNPYSLPAEYLSATGFESVFVDTSISYAAAFKTIFTRKAYQVNRFYSKAFAKKIAEVLKKDQFDIIHLESLFTTPYIPVIRQHSKAKIVLRTHNIDPSLLPGRPPGFEIHAPY